MNNKPEQISDDLANQGRSVGRDLNNGFPVTVERCHIIEQMADRIEELEAKLAKAVELALEECPFAWGTGSYNDWWHHRRTTIAELTGGKDE